MVIASFFHIAKNGKTLLSFIDGKHFNMYTYHNFLLHDSVDGHLDWFHNIVIVNSASIVIDMHISLWHVSKISTNSRAESHDRPIFSVIRTFHSDFHSAWTSQHSLLSTPLLSFVDSFLMTDPLNGVKWNLRVVWFAFLWWWRMFFVSFSTISILPFVNC